MRYQVKHKDEQNNKMKSHNVQTMDIIKYLTHLRSFNRVNLKF